MTDWSLQHPLLKAVRVDDTCQYLLQRGWVRRPHARRHVILFEGPLDDDGAPIIQLVPSTETAPEYLVRIQELLRALSVIEGRPAVRILRDIVTRSSVEPSPSHTAWYDFTTTVQPIVLDEIESRQPVVLALHTELEIEAMLKSARDVYDAVHWPDDPDRNSLIVTAARVAIALRQLFEPDELVPTVAKRILTMWQFDCREFTPDERQRINELAAGGDEGRLCDLFDNTMIKSRTDRRGSPAHKTRRRRSAGHEPG